VEGPDAGTVVAPNTRAVYRFDRRATLSPFASSHLPPRALSDISHQLLHVALSLAFVGDHLVRFHGEGEAVIVDIGLESCADISGDRGARPIGQAAQRR